MRSSKAMCRLAAGLCGLWMLAGCGGSNTIRVTNQDRAGDSNVWVCEGGQAQDCHNLRVGDFEAEGGQDRLHVVTPPEHCQHGAANFDIVIESGDVKRVRYECAYPSGSKEASSGEEGGLNAP